MHLSRNLLLCSTASLDESENRAVCLPEPVHIFQTPAELFRCTSEYVKAIGICCIEVRLAS